MGIETTSVERCTIRMTKHDGMMESCLVGIETTSVERCTIRMTKHDGMMESCLVGIETTSVERRTIRMTKHDGSDGVLSGGYRNHLCRKTHNQNDKT